MREYLLRGGFLLIDDFWGQRQWDNFYSAFSQVFPDREVVELKPDHEIFHVYYDIDGPQMIPALFRNDEFGEQGINFATNHAILDDDGRVMVLINWNSTWVMVGNIPTTLLIQHVTQMLLIDWELTIWFTP